ncbi:MAG: putative zinc-binding metallopeptidase [Sedimentisphaerales bacterium]|nr:putative zinc-binding metallopeptidase [Sedimentisphaerales bacterium]
MTKSQKTRNWQSLPDDELLGVRIRDLKLQIAGTWLEPLVERLYDELDAQGIRFHPPCYLADEWLTPDKIPIIGIPFCLTDRRLMEIEQKMMYEVEGGTEVSCMRLLRHECGHALNYAYRLYRRTRWRELFGHFSATYGNSYYFQPYSRRFVINLKDNYAQSHPDEDFAETFAVWLTPDSQWEQKYRDWPVIKKLRYTDKAMKGIAEKAPLVTCKGQPPYSAGRMTSTLAAHYERKRRVLGSEFQGYYDDGLKELFTAPPDGRSTIKASRLLRSRRNQLVNNVARWTGHRKFDIDQLVYRLAARCEVLDLYAVASNEDEVVGLTAMLTAIASNTLTISSKRR